MAARTWALALWAAAPISALNLFAEPLAIEASAEVPVAVSFTTGSHPLYGVPYQDDDSTRMMVSLGFEVLCQPAIELCEYFQLGLGGCAWLLEAPRLPPVARCVTQPGVLTLELAGTLESNTRYDLLVLGVSPPPKRILSFRLRILAPAAYVDVTQLPALEEETLQFVPELVTRLPDARIAGLRHLGTVPVPGDRAQFSFSVTADLGAGSEIRIFTSPFFQEGISSTEHCQGFNTVGFAQPLRGTCLVEALPEDRGANALLLRLDSGIASAVSSSAQFRVTLRRPRGRGSVGRWFAASRTATGVGFDKILGAGPFFLAPPLEVISDLQADSSFGARQSLQLTIFPNADILGSSAPPALRVVPPSLHRLSSCSVAAPRPDAQLTGPSLDDAYCELLFKENQNLYAHQSVAVTVEVTNPLHALPAEMWQVVFESSAGAVTALWEGWPVYPSLQQVFLSPLTLEVAQWNEIQIFFKPRSGTAAEARALVTAPEGFAFDLPCGLDVIAGFPDPGVTCANPLSSLGHNLFALQLPMSVGFLPEVFYAANLFPLRNPSPSFQGTLDDLQWRIDLLSLAGAVLETSRNIPMGPYLQGFRVYQRTVLDGLVQPSQRLPSARTTVVLSFRLTADITSHGTRLRMTAPYGYRWVIGGAPTAEAAESPVNLASIVYDPIYAPVSEPKNQLELSLVNPSILAGTDIKVTGEIWNAAVDPELHPDLRSANVWMLEIYEAGAGYLEYQYRYQGALIPGYELQAITAASISAWLPLFSAAPRPVMVTFRLGTSLAGGAGRGGSGGLELVAPQGFHFPQECRVDRISPLHLEIDGYNWLPPGALAECRGINETGLNSSEDISVASVQLALGAVLQKRLIYAIYLEVHMPDTFPVDNSWRLRTVRAEIGPTEEVEISGFRPAGRFLSATYHPGTQSTGEDLRSGAADNRVIFSFQASTSVPINGELRITAPYRFTFAKNCLHSVHAAAALLAQLEGADIYQDLPSLRSCLGLQNVARLVLSEPLDAAIRYSVRLGVANPVMPHPGEWPLAQDLWRFESFEPLGILDAAEVQAFFLWSFQRASLVPLVLGAGEQGSVSIEVSPSLTLPPKASLLITAPQGYVLPTPCEGFEPDTGQQVSLPETTACMRGFGGLNVIQLQLDDFSYLAAGVIFRFQLGVINPPEARDMEYWTIASTEQTELGETYLEQNPAVTGYPVHLRLASFGVVPSSSNAAKASTVRFEFSLPEELGVFQVVSSTEASFIVVDMPPFFTVPVVGENSTTPFTADFEAVNILRMKPCAAFARLAPEQSFPTQADACISEPGSNSFRLRLESKLDVGPNYVFSVQVFNPALTALRQQQITQANFWQLRLARHLDGLDSTLAGRSAAGAQLRPLLQECTVEADPPLPTNFVTTVRISFRPVTPLASANGDRLVLHPPASVVPSVEGCSLTVDALPVALACEVAGSEMVLRLQGTAVVPGDSRVQVEIEANTGPLPLSGSDASNSWDVMTQGVSGTWDEAPRVPGFTIFPQLLDAVVIPKDVSSMSFVNHADFAFRSPVAVPPGCSLRISAPESFRLYARTFAAGTGLPVEAPAQQVAEGEVQVALGTLQLQLASFKLTIGNPAVSPPVNRWTLELRTLQNATLALDRGIEGFAVRSSFNFSVLDSEVDEPLAENYVHLAVAVAETLYADSFGQSRQCTSQDKLCVYATWLEVLAPEGFAFQATCGYWALARPGGRFRGLPPGSLCVADTQKPNIARVRLSLSLSAFTIYEFTLQVRNALSVPLDNFWELNAVQDGIARERDQVEGFPLRQMRTVRVTPVTTLAGAVDNSVTALLRTTRPVPPGAMVTVVAPLGFIFDTSEVSSSFQRDQAPVILQDLLTAQLPSGAAIRFHVSQQDYVAPNTFFYVSARIRNPAATPASNYWYFYVQTQFMEHIDLRKFLPGFVISYRMPFFQVYPNSLPWNLGTANDISLLFVTSYTIFSQVSQGAGWQLLLVAPQGFTVTTKGSFSEACSGFQRWGGKESYDQLPDVDNLLTCRVANARTAVLDVPPTWVNETRYSFRLNVTVADRQDDVALQQPWTLTVLWRADPARGGEPQPAAGGLLRSTVVLGTRILT
ncbi:unnamed protein product [Effrenium voratum]|uniref:Uncharacterized protein n=1 Tax=Effrenium voratum TaxID=2562239 RepID=A0AA36IV71_9DINO|nr:unnamed protein product [Effrenium voratum]